MQHLTLVAEAAVLTNSAPYTHLALFLTTSDKQSLSGGFGLDILLHLARVGSNIDSIAHLGFLWACRSWIQERLGMSWWHTCK